MLRTPSDQELSDEAVAFDDQFLIKVFNESK